MHHAPSVLALDAGQTGIRARLLAAGAPVAEQEFGGVLTDRPVLPQLAAVARQALTGRSAQLLAVGSSGLTDEMQADALLQLVADLGFSEVRLAHDSVTSYLGALGQRFGVVVAAGTGVVTLAVGEREVARVDGWGNLLGDAGSGYWIGRAALEAVMRAHDGRGPATALTPLALAEFDDDLEGAYMVLQADEHRVSRIARWGKAVAELAATDEVCRRISEAAGQELALSAATGLRRVGQLEHAAASTVGKVFASPVVTDSFQRALREQVPGVELVPAAGSGLDGAAELAGLTPQHPLFQHVRTAGTAPGGAATTTDTTFSTTRTKEHP